LTVVAMPESETVAFDAVFEETYRTAVDSTTFFLSFVGDFEVPIAVSDN
jgi:hypothetical protein